MIGFNPLAGIRCFLTISSRERTALELASSFNPLAGIRCFLTVKRGPSPLIDLRLEGFNPLAGIRCFLTRSCVHRGFVWQSCFNPLAGIRCFLTSYLEFEPLALWLLLVSIP